MDLDITYDKMLNISTTGRDDSILDNNVNPYEPTPYKVLDRLVSSGYITKKNYLIDYGCGKGRVDFYLSYQTKCHSIGIECNLRLYNKCLLNKKNALNGGRCEFYYGYAEDYKIDDNIDRFFLFNPFSIKTLDKVLENVHTSYLKCNREMLFMYYYPFNKCEDYLLNNKYLECIDIIKLDDLFNGNLMEKIIVLRVK